MTLCPLVPENQPHTVEDVLRMQLKSALATIRQLKAKPTLDIVKHGPRDRHPHCTQYRFGWREYAHQTLVSDEVPEESYYREYIIRQGIEAVVRECAKDMMDHLITRECTAKEFYSMNCPPAN